MLIQQETRKSNAVSFSSFLFLTVVIGIATMAESMSTANVPDTQPKAMPTNMRAAQVKDYGPVDEMLDVLDDVAVPSLEGNKDKTCMIVETLAVALSPGDCRVLSGITREIQGPPSFPYVPGGDCCGVVRELSPLLSERERSELPFGVGDRVAVRFVTAGPRGAMARYAVVHTTMADKIPDDGARLSAAEAAALAGASPAVEFADKILSQVRNHVRRRQGGEGGEEKEKKVRVLLLGAGGGMGSHLCQLLRLHEGEGVSYHIVGVTRTEPDRLLKAPYNCDEVVDYGKENAFRKKEYLSDPFDVVIDLASGGWLEVMKSNAGIVKGNAVVKPYDQGGLFITTTIDTPTFEIHSMWGAMQQFLFPSMYRSFMSFSFKRGELPKYSFNLCLSDNRDVMTRTLDLGRGGKLKACVDGPYPFTARGVREAFRAQKERHTKGKVVVDLTKTS